MEQLELKKQIERKAKVIEAMIEKESKESHKPSTLQLNSDLQATSHQDSTTYDFDQQNEAIKNLDLLSKQADLYAQLLQEDQSVMMTP